MFGSLKKAGFIILVISIIISFILKALPIDQYIRIAISTFGIGTGIIFIMFGNGMIPRE